MKIAFTANVLILLLTVAALLLGHFGLAQKMLNILFWLFVFAVIIQR